MTVIRLTGHWNIQSLALFPEIRQKLDGYDKQLDVVWSLNEISALDSAGAWVIWQGWGKQMPTQVKMRPAHRQLIDRWQNFQLPWPAKERMNITMLIDSLWGLLGNFGWHLLNWTEMLGQLMLDAALLLRHPALIPWEEISITIYEAGVRALGITALVGFLIGIVLSYLSALQLHAFGAEIYIIDILGLSIIRELGPLLGAVLVAGRSGSSMTAQIGIMRVTEELDALSAMGVSHSLRLVLPKVAALTVTLPLITIWTDIAALIGGMVSAQHTLDISFQQFFIRLPDVVPLVNVFIGVGKAAVFGVLVALIACHFGFLIKPNTESLGNNTTNSVVASITAVIMADAVFAILFMHVGMP
ncbi:MAG: MlaE family ABC transporter permease [Gammaproteobacteria bacterium]